MREPRIGRVGSVALLTIAALGLILAREARAVTVSLSEAFDRALRSSPRLRAACDEVASSRYGLDIAESEFELKFLPTAESGLASDTQTAQRTVFRLSKKLPIGTVVELAAGTTSTEDDFYRSFSGITVSQPVFQGFGRLANERGRREAGFRIADSERRRTLVRDLVVTEVVEAFYRILGQDDSVTILERGLERAHRRLTVAEARMKRELATKLDVHRAEAHAARAEEALIESLDAAARARDDLKLLLALDLDVEVDVEPELVTIPRPDERALVEHGLEDRPEVLDARARVDETKMAVAFARRGLFPDFRIGVNVSVTGSGAGFEESLDFGDSGVRFLLGGSSPIGTTVSTARAEQARLELVQRRRELRSVEREVELEVRRAARHLDSLARRVSVQENQVVAARAGLELAELRFERGYAELLELLDAEDALSQAEREVSALRIEEVVGAVRLLRAGASIDRLVEAVLGEPAAGIVCEGPA